ncbi:glycoside hydrolase family 6 protein [Streptomyces cavernicola]|uniref:Glucanase n=1 Tax=Streptomyces cavernicola TaxID=3043613 RepID=A0ABT6S8F4_9ACTN|nr:glycoside hydrolase family 6 protein [Streptomyces sp. B-S-A6]MDI3404386.1 glycoside hydrolase family 6 protein [Streptomyces sp. B-S-A6]
MYGSEDQHYDRSAGRGWKASAAAVGAVLLIAGCSSGESGKDPDPGGSPVRQQPKASDPYWVDPQGNAAKQVAEYRHDGNDRDAEQIEKIASQPVAEWITDPDAAAAETQVREHTEAATKADRDALLALYNIPHRDCGQYSKGGAADGNAYRTWIDAVAKGIGDRRATVVLEPDALLHVVDGCTPGEFHGERFDLLKGAIEKLKSLQNTKVYLDGGNPGGPKPNDLYQPLKSAGIDQADGFAVNVSNYYGTQESTAFGKELSMKFGNKPFVIDTSRNGNGPYTEGNPDERWCNPPGRALGEAPTTKTADDAVDAYLWIKRPGESDGECKGGPPAGQWWPEYALGLAKGAK